MDYVTLLYNPIYETFGVPAELTPNLYDNAGVASPIIYRCGASSTGTAFTGQLHGLRVTKGVDRYPDNFSPPTIGMFPAYAA